jgi:hypothetical protein
VVIRALAAAARPEVATHSLLAAVAAMAAVAVDRHRIPEGRDIAGREETVWGGHSCPPLLRLVLTQVVPLPVRAGSAWSEGTAKIEPVSTRVEKAILANRKGHELGKEQDLRRARVWEGHEFTRAVAGFRYAALAAAVC